MGTEQVRKEREKFRKKRNHNRKKEKFQKNQRDKIERGKQKTLEYGD